MSSLHFTAFPPAHSPTLPLAALSADAADPVVHITHQPRTETLWPRQWATPLRKRIINPSENTNRTSLLAQTDRHSPRITTMNT